jgi:pimeloyl-ACP methyl ester carboxylesterase
MSDSRTSPQIKLRDGRSLGYAEYGDPEGKPVFYFHGFPSSRLDWPLFDVCGSAAELNARIIAVDRPGTGLSSFKRGREILDWPDDVIELADALRVDRFAVLGISGGGPYATACAFKIPERLTATGIVCGMGPPNAPGMKEGGSWTLPGKPWLMRRLLLTMLALGLRNSPDRVMLRSKETFSEPDKRLLDQPELAKVFVDSLREAFRSSISGANQDALLYARPWRFRLEDITAVIHVWHGEPDLTVTVAVGRYFADTIPNCHATFFEDEGHFTLLHNKVGQILGTMVA